MAKKATDIYSGTIFSECAFMHEGFFKNIANRLKEERNKQDELAMKKRHEEYEKDRKKQKDAEYAKIPKEERDKIDEILSEIFNKLVSHVKSKCSSKASFYTNDYDNYDNNFYRYIVADNKSFYDKYYEDVDEYIESKEYTDFNKLMYRTAESFCKSNKFDIIESSAGTDMGYYYIFAKGKKDTEYENIEFDMAWVEDSGAEYKFRVEYIR